jgi:hypothetical protein
MRLEQVSYCQASSQGRAMAAIEQKQGVRRVLIEAAHHSLAQVSTGPRSAQALALEAQERNFIQRVTPAEPIVEFEAIDDADRVAEPDVFGAQIAMSVNDAPAEHTVNQKIATLRQEPALHCIELGDQASR